MNKIGMNKIGMNRIEKIRKNSSNYIESVIALNSEFEEEAIDILRHLSTVERLWKEKVSFDETITELETEYTRTLGEEFEPENRMK